MRSNADTGKQDPLGAARLEGTYLRRIGLEQRSLLFSKLRCKVQVKPSLDVIHEKEQEVDELMETGRDSVAPERGIKSKFFLI